MKNCLKYAVTATLTVAVILLCAACGELPANKDDKLHILCTVFPLYDWSRNIAGDTADVSLLNENGADMHSFQPTAADIVRLNSCDILIYTGGESEKWVSDVIKRAENKELKALNLLELLGDKAVQEREEGAETRETGDETDEHIWLSLKNAELLTDKICEALSAADGKSSAVYRENAKKYTERLKELDEKYTAALENAKPKALVFADRFPFRYLTEDYGLDYYAAFPGCSAETEASFETIAFLAKKADECDYIFVTETANRDIADAVNRNTKTKDKKVLTLDSMQSVKKKDIENGITYLSVMEKNLEALIKGVE